MKTLTFLVGFWLLLSMLSLSSVNGQCPPQGFPTASDTCSSAPIICFDINGFCGTLNTSNYVHIFPGCPSSVLNNDEYVRFVAASDSIALLVKPSNCQGYNGQFGMQGSISTGCNGQILAAQCNCTTLDFVLAAGNLTVGAEYVLMLDGCAGDICDYSIELLFGDTDPSNALFVPVQGIVGPQITCPERTISYALENDPPGLQYNWYSLPAGAATINASPSDSLALVTWHQEGQLQLCVESFNGCAVNPEKVCLDVMVENAPLQDSTYIALCHGECILLPDSSTVCVSGAYQVLLPGGMLACDTLRTYFVEVLPELSTSLPEQVVCGSFFTICDDIVLDSSAAYVVSCTSVEGCDSLVSFDLTLLHPMASIQEPGSFCLPGVELDATASVFSEGNNISRQIIWEGPAGGLVIGNDSLHATAILPGTYCLTIFEEKNGVSCQSENCVEINLGEISLLPELVQLCTGETAVLDASSPAFITWLWSTGDTTAAIEVDSPGNYSLIVQDSANCLYSAVVEVVISDEPTLLAQDSFSFCANETLQLTALAGFSTYHWSTGDSTATVVIDEAGWHFVHAATQGGCMVVDSFWVEELPLDDLALPDFPLCNGDFPFLFTAPDGYLSYSWSHGDSTQTAVFDSAGTYQLTVLQPNGCFATDQLTLFVSPFDVPDFPDTFSICDQTSPATITLPDTLNYIWSSGDSTNSVLLEGFEQYSVTMTNDHGCLRVDTFLLTTQPSNILHDYYQACPEDFPITLMTNETFLSYSWSTGSSAPQITVNNEGVYSVIVQDAFGCFGSSSTEVVKLTPPPVNLGDSELTLCPEDFPYALEASGSYDLILWSTGAMTPTLTISNPGLYAVTVSDSEGCQNFDQIFIHQAPGAELQNELPDTTVCLSSLPIVIDAGPGQALYLWSTGDHTQTITLDSQDITEPGFYLFSLYFESVQGCRGLSNFLLTAELCSSTSRKKLSGSLRLQPNPARGNAKLLYSGLPLGTYQLSLYQPQGKRIWQRELFLNHESGGIDLPVERLSPGVYIIHLASQQGHRVLKLVVERA